MSARTTLAGLFALATLVVGWMLVAQPGANDCEDRVPDTPPWRTGGEPRTEAELEARRAVADAIVECRLIDGRSTRAVRSLLGPSHGGTANVWTYVVGDERSMTPVDSEVLEVVFGAGRVTAVHLGAT